MFRFSSFFVGFFLKCTFSYRRFDSTTLSLVDAGSNAIIFNRISGMKPYVINEGTHFCIPFIERPIIYSVRTKPTTIPSLTGSKGCELCVFRFGALLRSKRLAFARCRFANGSCYVANLVLSGRQGAAANLLRTRTRLRRQGVAVDLRKHVDIYNYSAVRCVDFVSHATRRTEIARAERSFEERCGAVQRFATHYATSTSQPADQGETDRTCARLSHLNRRRCHCKIETSPSSISLRFLKKTISMRRLI